MTTAASSETVPESTQNYRHIFEFQILSWNRVIKSRRILLTRLFALLFFFGNVFSTLLDSSAYSTPAESAGALTGSVVFSGLICLGAYWLLSRPMSEEERAYFEEEAGEPDYENPTQFPVEFEFFNKERAIGARGLFIARIISIFCLFIIMVYLSDVFSGRANLAQSIGPLLARIIFVSLFLYILYRILSRPMSDSEKDRYLSETSEEPTSTSSTAMREIECPECATPTDATNLHCPQCGSELR